MAVAYDYYEGWINSVMTGALSTPLYINVIFVQSLHRVSVNYSSKFEDHKCTRDKNIVRGCRNC